MTPDLTRVYFPQPRPLPATRPADTAPSMAQTVATIAGGMCLQDWSGR